MFYGLLAIAINTMSQPTGRICDAPAHINFPIRISPIMCAIDTLVMFGRLLYYRVRYYRSLAECAKAVIVERFHFDDDENAHRPGPSGARAARVLGFAVILTQVVKIFVSENVVLTKVWAGIYLFHWLCGEGLIFLKDRMTITVQEANNYRWELRDHGIGSLTWTSVTIAALFPLVFGALGASGLMKETTGHDWSCVQFVAAVVAIFGSIPFAIVTAYAWYAGARPRANGRTFAAIFGVVGAPAIIGAIPVVIEGAADIRDVVAETVTVILAVLWVVCGLLFWAKQVLEPFFERFGTDGQRLRMHLRRIEMSLSVWLFLIHLASALIYYQYAYSIQGKTRPWWSENLG